MNRLERLDAWCGRFLEKMIRYDDLITFFMFATLLLVCVIALVVGTLGMLGYLK